MHNSKLSCCKHTQSINFKKSCSKSKSPKFLGSRTLEIIMLKLGSDTIVSVPRTLLGSNKN